MTRGRQAGLVYGEPRPNELVRVKPKARVIRYGSAIHPLAGQIGRLLATELDMRTGEMQGRLRLADNTVALVPLRCVVIVPAVRAPNPLPPALAPVGIKPSYLAPVCCPPPHVMR